MLAAGLTLLLATVAGVFTLRLEKHEIHAAALESSVQKDLGVVWQRAAIAESDILPLYGSSELVKRIGNEPQHFFASYPTGFAVSPVGRAGCTSLILAEKIGAAACAAAPQRKLAISISPSWFFHTEAHHRWYVGNFSAAQASALIFSPRLSVELKRDFARRMLDFPDSLERAPLLSFALHRLVGRGSMDAALYRAVAPVGRAQNVLAGLSDHFAFALHLLNVHERPEKAQRLLAPLDWQAILATAESEMAGNAPKPHRAHVPTFVSNRTFAHVLGTSREWGDLELLLRVARELDLDPLLLSIPVDYPYYESIGVTRTSLDQYLDHLHALAGRYDAAVIDFADHEDDATFFADHHDHLSARGWLYMDCALDFYYHDSTHQHYVAPAGMRADEQRR
jgi:D-alanine transfer protein